ncbi:MAG: hypothetical protein P8H46_05645, partial [Paracoccaceae bacterium]|nr:hypothetical protein [Paracoccaceae bacterium]
MFNALVVSKNEEGQTSAAVTQISMGDLPDGEVVVAVEYSTVNWKDGACMGSGGGMVRNYPHVPGVDFSGTVESSTDPRYKQGDKVILTGWRVGEAYWGGYSQKASVKADWLVPLPSGLTTKQAMAVGTAGFSAMLALQALEDQGLKTDEGPVLVTGAAGGVGSMATTGRGADLLIIDDPHSEQDALSPTAMEACWEWYTSGPRQRLQPGGAIILVMTRWSSIDLTAKLLDSQKESSADQWEVVEFPAIFPETSNPLWPEFWSIEELEKVKASLPVQKWNAQWMQTPTSEEGSIVKREWWNAWESEALPPVSYIIQSYDTAFSKKETADYSAISTWGVFRPTPDSPDCIILLDAQKDRWDFPELKRVAYEEYNLLE